MAYPEITVKFQNNSETLCMTNKIFEHGWTEGHQNACNNKFFSSKCAKNLVYSAIEYP